MRYPKNVGDILVLEIADLHNSEAQLRLALPSMQKAAAYSGLQDFLHEYRQCLHDNTSQLREIAEGVGCDVRTGFCPCMAELIDEYSLKQDIPSGVVRDASLICVLQKISHYKLAHYRGAGELARVLGLAGASEVLAALLQKETAMNDNLNDLALRNVRPAGMIQQQTVSASR